MLSFLAQKKRLINTSQLLLSLVLLLLIGCSQRSSNQPSASERAQQGQHNTKRYDPLEHFNRAAWHFNYDVLDRHVIRPIAVLWNNCVPIPIRHGVGNVLGNLDEVSTSVNYLLQAQFHQALVHVSRFILNSTWGLAGLIDVAAQGGLPKQTSRQFGDVLGYYGVSHGPYVMLPGYGPATPRQQLGHIPDLYYFPLSFITFWGHASKWLLEGVEKRAQLISKESILQHSPDSYSAFREAYFQRRDFIAQDGEAGHLEHNSQHIDQEALEALD